MHRSRFFALMPFVVIAFAAVGCSSTASRDVALTVDSNGTQHTLATGSPGGAGTPSTSPQPGTVTPSWRQMFGGSLMTDERAREIAEAAGYKYMGFGPCAPASDSCAALDVRERGGKTGRPLRFLIKPRDIGACMTVTQGTGATPIAGRVAENPIPPPTVPLPGYYAAEPVGAKCLANHPIIMRAIYNGTSTFLPRYTATQMMISYQEAKNGYWSSRYVFTTGTLVQPLGGAQEETHYYEIRDGSGNLLAADRSSVRADAGSMTGLTQAQQCAAIAKGVENLSESSQAAFQTACTSTVLDLSVETPLGEVSSGLDLCAAQDVVATQLREVLQEGVNAACNARPECFLSGTPGTCHGDIILPEWVVPYFAEWMAPDDVTFFPTGPGVSCPNKKTTKTPAGEGCTQTVVESCDEIGTVCICSKVSAETICIDETPDAR